MAVTKAPLLSMDASGTVAGAVVFSKWRGRNYVRKHVVPANPKSGLQVGVRSVFGYLASAYAALSASIKTAWNAEGDADRITGLNAQIRFNIDRARRNLGWYKEPSPAPVTTPDAPTGGAAAAAPKSLNLSWVRPAGNMGDYTVAVYMSTVTGFTPDISNLVLVQPVATVTATIKGLTTGTPYYFRNRETNSDGDLGALQAEWTGTPT